MFIFKRYAAIFGLSSGEKFRRKAEALAERYTGHPDVADQAQRLFAALSD